MTVGQDIGMKTVGQDETGPKRRRPLLARLRTTVLHVVSVHGLLVFGILLVIFFSILLPTTFTGSQTFRAILGNNPCEERIIGAAGSWPIEPAKGTREEDNRTKNQWN